MITIIPVPEHSKGEISLNITFPTEIKKKEEIKDNEQARNFRTWYVETDSNEKNIMFNLSNRETIVFKHTCELSEAISLTEFIKRERSRIKNARNDDFDAICRDSEELNRCLEKNNLVPEDIVHIIEFSKP